MIVAALTLALAAPSAAQPLLEPLSRLVGHCWRGSAPGNAGTDTHCFESVYGGQHIRDRHVVTVDAKPVYEGETLYSVENGGVTFTYWNSLGGIGRGRMFKADGDLRFAGTIHGSPAAKEESFSTIWRTGTTSYQVIDPGEQPRLFKRVD